MKVSHAVIGRIIPPKSVDSVTVNSIVNRYTAISLSELAQATNEFSFVSQISTALSAISQLGSQQQSLHEVVGRVSTSELLKKKKRYILIEIIFFLTKPIRLLFQLT